MVGKGLMKANFQPNLACDFGFIPFVAAKRDQLVSVTTVGLGLENYIHVQLLFRTQIQEAMRKLYKLMAEG